MVENFINKILILLLISNSKEEIDTSKMLIIYFTFTGNTELFTSYIKEIINVDSYKIEPINSYQFQSINYIAKKRKERKSSS